MFAGDISSLYRRRRGSRIVNVPREGVIYSRNATHRIVFFLPGFHFQGHFALGEAVAPISRSTMHISGNVETSHPGNSTSPADRR